MKNTFKYLFGTLALAGAMVACSPEEFDGMSESGIVQTSQYKDLFEVSVDQTINQVTVNFKGASEVYPVWELHLADGKVEYSTAATLQRIIMLEGDYSVKCYIGNRHGISKDCVELPFHINESIIDYTKYYTLISKGTWYMDNNAVGHIACGPTLEDPTGWWKAGVDEKAAFGVYDNALTFSADGKYGFDPGAAGTIYANKCVSKLNTTGATEDFTVPMDAMTTNFEFKAEGEDLYILFPGQTPFPYIASDQIWDTPRYKVVSLTAKAMTLASFQITNDNPDGIGWQYILTTQHEVKEVFNGFDVNSEDNLWKLANPTFLKLYYAHGDSWEGLPDYEHSEEGGVFTIKLPTATNAQWQAQYHLETELSNANVPADATYDFSCIVTPTNDIAGMTIKLTSSDDAISLIDQRVDVAGLEDNVVYFTELPGQTLDGNYKIVFDFGGNPDNTDIVIKDIVLIDHSKNKVSVPGNDTPEEPSADWSGENLLAGMPIEISQYYAHGSGWEGLPEYEHSEVDGVYTVKLPTATDAQWQAQYTFNNTGISLDPEKSYDFRVKIVSTTDHPGITVKLTQQDNDEIFLTEGRHAVNAYEETWIELVGLKVNKEQITNLKMPFDFGQNAENTEIVISEMHLQEHKASGPEAVDWTKPNLLASMPVDLSKYYAHGSGWEGLPEYEHSEKDGVFTVMLPTATDAQWQAQFTFNNTGISLDPEKSYDFRVKLTSNTDHPGVTVKLTQQDNDEIFLTEDRHPLEAYEETWIELVGLKVNKGQITNLKMPFDFGQNAADTEIVISDMHLQEH